MVLESAFCCLVFFFTNSSLPLLSHSSSCSSYLFLSVATHKGAVQPPQFSVILTSHHLPLISNCPLSLFFIFFPFLHQIIFFYYRENSTKINLKKCIKINFLITVSRFYFYKHKITI